MPLGLFMRVPCMAPAYAKAPAVDSFRRARRLDSERDHRALRRQTVHRALPLTLACLLLTACASAPPPIEPTATVGSPGNPVLLVAYTPNETVRVRFEDQLEADLAAKDIRAVPGHELVSSFSLLNREQLLVAAGKLNAPMVLMVRRVITEMPDDGSSPPAGIRLHRTLQEYLLNVDRQRLPELPPAGRQVLEVAGYLRNAGTTELVWSGYSWVDYDGDLDAAIAETSETIARNLAPACQGIRCDF